MFGKKTASLPLQAVIGEDSRVVGDVACDTAICVEGKVIGDIKAVTVTIDRTGSVEGLIEAGTLEIYGLFRGEAMADRIVVRATADIEGPLSYRTILIEEGAKITSALTLRNAVEEPPKPSTTLLMASSGGSS